MIPILHGGGLDAAVKKFGGAKHDWLDLSTGINPNSYPIGGFEQEVFTRLPDQGAEQALLEAARTYYQVPDTGSIVAGNGTQSLIELLPRLETLTHIAILSPTYGEHEHVWAKAGISITNISNLKELPDSADGLVVVNPNNPDCYTYDAGALREASAHLKILVVDEAFADPYPELSSVMTLPDNMIVLRSFGKFFGLAGVRLGFAISKEKWVGQLKSMLGPWAVSGVALEIGTRALQDIVWIEQTKTHLQTISDDMAKACVSAGLQVVGQNSLFVYAACDDANRVYQALAKRQILVRAFPSDQKHLRFGLCQDASSLQRFETALAEIMNG